MHDRKRGFLAVIAVSLCVGLSGCGDGVELSQEQNDLIAQYAANKVLQADPDYAQKLETTTTTAVTATTVAQATTEADATTENSATPDNTSQKQQKNKDHTVTAECAAIFQPLGVKVTDIRCRKVRSYNDKNNSSLSVDASAGKKLAVVQVTVKNLKKQPNTVDFLKYNATYTLHTASGDETPVLTMLSNDITSYKGTLKAKGSRRLVVLFEVPENEDLHADCTMEISKKDISCTVALP